MNVEKNVTLDLKLYDNPTAVLRAALEHVPSGSMFDIYVHEDDARDSGGARITFTWQEALES